MKIKYSLSILCLLCIFAFGLNSMLSAQHTKVYQRLGDFLRELMEKSERIHQERPEDRLYLHADKPFYKPGETIWFSSYVRDGASMKASSKSEIVYAELINPKGNVAQKLTLIAKKGVAQGEFQLDASAVGGIYKVKTYTKWQENDPKPAFFEKEIQVQKVILPRLKMKLDFQRKAYSPGSRVAADLELQTNANEALSFHDFTVVAQLDGKEMLRNQAKTNSQGASIIQFDLPPNLETNDGLLNILISYQGMTESISRSIPIVLNDIELQLLPEGGDLVMNQPGRVAFKALNEFGKAADIEGVVLNQKDEQVATFKSFHQGMGAFNITPKTGEQYTVKITQPAVDQLYALPEPLPRGFVLEVREVADDFVDLHVYSTEEETVSLIAQVRGKPYFGSEFDLKVGDNHITIPTKDFPIGVAQITLFDSKGIERAERLTFVNQNRQLNIDLKTNKEKYLPREKVELTVKVSDERGMPMPANLSLSVVDDQLLSFADDKSSNILSWLLVEADLRGKVEEPNFYFDPKEEKAEQALDYLLMTAGWRRFTWEEVLANNLPAIKQQGELAVVKGRVFDSYMGNPIPSANLHIKDQNIKTSTDAQGNFTITGLDLSKEVKVEVQAPNFVNSETMITQYSSNLSIGLFPNNAGFGNGFLEDAEEVDELQIVAIQDFQVAAAAPMNEIAAVAKPGRNKTRGERGRKKVEAERPTAVPVDLPQADNAPAPPVVVAEAPEEPIQVNPDPAKPLDAKIAVEGVQEMEEEKVVLAKNNQEGLAIGERQAMGLVMDDRMLKDALQILPQQAQISYHRAREFAAPEYERPQEVEVRSDFRSTIYWNGNVEVGRNGKTTLSFYNSDDISSFRITAEGIAADGMLGRKEALFFTQMPFSMSTKVPVELVTEDKVSFPLTLVNNTTQSLTGTLELSVPDGLIASSTPPSSISIAAQQAKTIYLNYQVADSASQDVFKVVFRSKGFSDAFSREIKVLPKGFPVNLAYSGSETEKTYPISISNLVKNSLHVELTAYPSTVSEMMSGLESMLREPHGCFEQTSSSTYPNILALSYMTQTEQANPAVRDRALDLIDRGYKRLISFETSENGFEWFGQAPGHEGLTAYGLMEFMDMQKVYDGVDEKMISRTTDWLMKRRDGKGGFQRNPRALHQFGLSDQESMNAYIVYALSEAGISDLKKEMDASYEAAMKNKNPYQLGLVANALFNYEDESRANKALNELLDIQKEEGNWVHQSKDRSAPGTSGQSLIIESSSLALSAMMKSQSPNMPKIKKVVKFLQESRQSFGGYGNTQSTVLALRALVEYAQFSKRTDEDGTIEVYVDGKKVETISYEKGEQDAIVVAGLEKYMDGLDHDIKVKYVGVKNPLPYTLSAHWHTNLPPSAKECAVDLQTKLASNKVKVGETVRLTTNIINTTQEGQAMTLAIVGLPAGLSPQPWQLKELQEKKKVDFYEVIGNNVVFYFRQMEPSASYQISLDLKAEMPGTFEAPASSAYLYYTTEYKDWESLPPLTVVE